ncbi:MAG: J domain-containing protein [Clostridia bacterium]|nr:J domain-containing protein [Clostridia bacterium]
MKNYYEILEVNPKASKEVIEKAYRVLAKKYHPDLYTGEKKEYAERKIKELNAAYNILSDEFLREQYDSELKKENMEYTQNYYQGARERSNLKNNYQDARQKQVENSKQQRTKRPRVGTLGSMIELTKQLVHDLARSKEKRQKIKEMTKMDVIAIVLTIVVVILIGVILWFIPFTNGWMRELLFENPLFNWIGGLFS